MTKSIDFYFDFISPYSYLAHKKIINLNLRNIFNYKAILLGGLHNLAEVTPPAFNERKMKNMKDDCILIAKKNEISFKWNEKFPINSLYLMRGFLIVDDDKKSRFIDLCFDAYWKDNLDISTEKNMQKILTDCAIDRTFFEKSIKEQKIKDKLKDLTSEAFKLDVFGAPTFLVNNKLFWGQDRLEYAIEELENFL
jgi:2-hydroxychromene-2-carboxylate isomerase